MVAVVVVLVVEAATEVAAEEVVMTVLKVLLLGSNLKVEDAEVIVIRLAADLHDVHQTLNQVVVAIFQEQEKAVDNKPMC